MHPTQSLTNKETPNAMNENHNCNRLPQMPVPATLGGGMMTTFVCRGHKSGDCTAPGCTSKPTTECRFPLSTRDGTARTCKRSLCEKHVSNEMCPAHYKLVQARTKPLP